MKYDVWLLFHCQDIDYQHLEITTQLRFHKKLNSFLFTGRAPYLGNTCLLTNCNMFGGENSENIEI